MVSKHTLLKLAMSTSPKSIRWVFDCSQWSITSPDWFKCLKSIQSEERERIGRFVFRNDAMSSMAAQLMIRKCLVDTNLSSWKKLRTVRSEKGKPHVPEIENVLFSVSHHGRLTVLAAEIFETKNKEKSVSEVSSQSYSTSTPVDQEPTSDDMMSNLNLSELKIKTRNTNDDNLGSNVECKLKSNSDKGANSSTREEANRVEEKIPLHLGVDICNQDLPRNTSIPEFFRLMRRNYHEDEWNYILAASTEATQLARFYRIWSLKESYVKATGTGIAVPLNEMSFDIRSDLGVGKFVYDTKLVLRGRIASEWHFEETQLKNHYCVAVALCNALPGDLSVEKKYIEITYGDLERMMEDLEVEDDEELYYASRDFVRKQLRPWDR